MSEKPSKVETEDVPKILAAIKRGVDSKQNWTLTITGASNGGIIGINLKREENLK
jgi:hypothetical protein